VRSISANSQKHLQIKTKNRIYVQQKIYCFLKSRGRVERPTSASQLMKMARKLPDDSRGGAINSLVDVFPALLPSRKGGRQVNLYQCLIAKAGQKPHEKP
jgi:hypothetical protein